MLLLIASLIVFVGVFWWVYHQFTKLSPHHHVLQEGSPVQDGKIRMVINAGSGSGKSTLAKQLSKQFNILRIDVDHHRFYPAKEYAWKNRPQQDFIRGVQEQIDIAERDEKMNGWVIDGTVTRFGNDFAAQVNMVIWLDYSPIVTILRLLNRIFWRYTRQEKCCNGNVETLSNLFLSRKDSILWYQLTSFGLQKQRLEKWIQENPHFRVFRFISPLDCRKFFDDHPTSNDLLSQ